MSERLLKPAIFRNAILTLCLFITVLVSQDFDSDIVQTKQHSFQVSLFSEGYEIPWGMAFLPNNELLVSDRNGKLYRVSVNGKKRSEITGVPEVLYKSQGGLLDIAVHPDFSSNKLVYIAYSHAIKRKSFTRIAMAKLVNDKLINLKVIFSVDKKHYTPRAIHFGSRIVFREGYIYFSVGDS